MKRLWWILVCCLFFLSPLLASSVTSNPVLGTLQNSNVILDFEGYQIETYRVLDTTYVPIFRLKEMGCPVTFNSQTNEVSVTTSLQTPLATPPTTPTLSGSPFMLYQHPVWIGGFQTHAIESQGRTLIPIGALRELWQIEISDTHYKMIKKTPLGIKTTRSQIINQTNEQMTITLTDLYWENKWVKETHDYTLSPEQTLTRTLPNDTETKYYVSSVVTQAIKSGTTYNNENMFGQCHDALFARYTRAKNNPVLGNLGDPIDMNQVIWAEDTVNRKNLPSDTPYLVWTNIDTQRTYIFKGSNGNWKLLKHFICSTGKDRSPTPKGEFKLTYKVPYFGVEKGYRCKNAFGFIGTTYLYHSILFDKTGSYLLEGKGVLGTKASDGCIRFSPENSEWFYNNLVSKTKVWIN